MHIITVATNNEFYFPYLKESCLKNGKELTVLGFGEKWQGFNWKFAKMIEHLKKLKSKDIVCFVDGYDVICTRNLNELQNKFIKIKNETGCKIIVGYDNKSTAMTDQIIKSRPIVERVTLKRTKNRINDTIN
jgi:predicted phosphohydrolase